MSFIACGFSDESTSQFQLNLKTEDKKQKSFKDCVSFHTITNFVFIHFFFMLLNIDSQNIIIYYNRIIYRDIFMIESLHFHVRNSDKNSFVFNY